MLSNDLQAADFGSTQLWLSDASFGGGVVMRWGGGVKRLGGSDWGGGDWEGWRGEGGSNHQVEEGGLGM